MPRGGIALISPTLALSSQISVYFAGTMDGARISNDPRGGLLSHGAEDGLADTSLTTEELAKELEALDAQRSVRFPQDLLHSTNL